MDLKEITFEEERREIIKRNKPRRKAIHDLLSKKKDIESSLFDILLTEKGVRNGSHTKSPLEETRKEGGDHLEIASLASHWLHSHCTGFK